MRYFDSTIEGLLDRGHEVLLAFQKPHLRSEALEVLDAQNERLVMLGAAPGRTDRYASVATSIRAAADYIRYLDPLYEDAEFLRNRRRVRALQNAPWTRVFGDRRSLGGGWARRINRVLLACERAVPSARELEDYISELNPHVVLVSPLVSGASPQTDYVKSARKLGVPTGLCVASWDNLTNKGLMREAPDAVFVWNDVQKAEAIELHGVPERKVIVTGAQAFDRWFGRQPSRTRDEFCREIGLPVDRPLVLFVGSSSNIAKAGVEEAFVIRWIEALRASGDDVLADAGILVRPHPDRGGSWDLDFSGVGPVTVWPSKVRNSVAPDARADFFDSLYHCTAVVGANTSAMIEAAIVGRPVLTILAPEFEQSHEGTIHFRYLRPENGGFVRIAEDLEEHAGQLAEAIRTPELALEQTERFVLSFVRPLGRDVDGTTVLVEGIERLGTSVVRHTAGSPARFALRPILFAQIIGGVLVRHIPGVASEERKSERARNEKERGRRLLRRGDRGSLKILFVMRHSGFVRNFDTMLRELARRGHRIHLAFEIGRTDSEVAESLSRDCASVSSGYAAARDDRWMGLASAVRYGIDYLRFLWPAYDRAPKLRARGRRGAPAVLAALTSLPGGRHPRVLRLLDRILRAIERAIPTSLAIDEYIRAWDPDLVLVTPLVAGPRQIDYVRSAKALGIPVALPVTSWDNLTNKGLIRGPVDRIYVWNETQRREAIELHNIDADRVVAVGAHTYDHWFEWKPSTTREEFCAKVGLDPEQPFVVYLCSSGFVVLDEPAVVTRWLSTIRNHGSRVLRSVGVLVRPHPAVGGQWEKHALEGSDNVVVWPPTGADPRDEPRKQDYFDTLYHSAAVVGINTSALIEAAIVGRHSYTFKLAEIYGGQEGTLHFHYLTRENGGPLVVADSLEEHAEQLAAALHVLDEESWNGEFLKSFVRPHGLDSPAGPRLASDLEHLAWEARGEAIVPGRVDRLVRIFLHPFARSPAMSTHPRLPTLRPPRRISRRTRKLARRYAYRAAHALLPTGLRIRLRDAIRGPRVVEQKRTGATEVSTVAPQPDEAADAAPSEAGTPAAR